MVVTACVQPQLKLTRSPNVNRSNTRIMLEVQWKPSGVAFFNRCSAPIALSLRTSPRVYVLAFGWSLSCTIVWVLAFLVSGCRGTLGPQNGLNGFGDTGCRIGPYPLVWRVGGVKWRRFLLLTCSRGAPKTCACLLRHCGGGVYTIVALRMTPGDLLNGRSPRRSLTLSIFVLLIPTPRVKIPVLRQKRNLRKSVPPNVFHWSTESVKKRSGFVTVNVNEWELNTTGECIFIKKIHTFSVMDICMLYKYLSVVLLLGIEN